MKKWLQYQIENKDKTMPILTFPIVQKMNISVLDFIKSSKFQAEGMKRIAQDFPTSASLSCMDLSIEAEAFGAKIKFDLDEIPTVIGSIIKNGEDVDNLTLPPVGAGRSGLSLESISKAKSLIKDKPIFAGVIGPFSLAGRLMDMTEVMINCYEEPEMVHKTLKLCSQFIINYIKRLKEAGADGVVMAEPAAGLLSPAICEEFSSSYIKQIVLEVEDEEFIFIYHNCGNVIPLAQDLIKINADVYHFGNAIDIEEMLKIMPKDKIIMGNINPVLLKDSTPEKIKSEVKFLLDRCSPYPNFIISTGCDLPPLTKWENIQAYFDTIKDYYNKEKK